MRQKRGMLVCLTALLAAAVLALAGCASMEPQGKSSACAPEGKVQRQIAPEAEVVEFSCYVDKYQKIDSLHFKVTLKNKSSVPQRFRVQIFLDNGKAVGGLIPRTTKEGLVQPGKTASFTYPVQGMTDQPGEIMLIVKTAS